MARFGTRAHPSEGGRMAGDGNGTVRRRRLVLNGQSMRNATCRIEMQNAKCKMQMRNGPSLHSEFCILHSAFCIVHCAFCRLPPRMPLLHFQLTKQLWE